MESDGDSLLRRQLMAMKRDRKGLENGSADHDFQPGVLDPRAFEQEGPSIADEQGHQRGEGDIEAWEDEETAPDLFAGTTDEDRVPASGGHTQRPGEEPGERERPDLRKR
jgi:hypothetical protein